MIWLTWRQQRTETLIAVVLLVLVAALIVPTGLQMASVYDSEGIACVPHRSVRRVPPDPRLVLEPLDTLLNFVGWLSLVPMLLGALIAAPLVLEFERGTFRLAWTQSVTRDRWLAIRVGLVSRRLFATGLFFMLLMTWWRDPLDDINGRFSEGFDFEGVVPVSYTLFAAALVLALGVSLRRAAAAIGLAFVLFLALRIGIGGWARPNYRERIEASWAEDRDPISRAPGCSARAASSVWPTAARPPIRRWSRDVSAAPRPRNSTRTASPTTASRSWSIATLSPGEPLLVVPGNRGEYLHRDGARVARVLRLVDPQADQLSLRAARMNV